MVQGLARGFHVIFSEAHVLKHRIEDAPASRVEAVVVEGLLEVRHVGRPVLPLPHLLPQKLVPNILDLLREGQHDGSQNLDVFLQGLSCHRHQCLVELHAGVAFVVFLLEDALIRLVLAANVGAHRVHQLILGHPSVPALVRHKHGSSAHFKQVVRNAHRPVGSLVVVLGDVFGADDERSAVGVALHELVHEGNADEAGAAPHAAEVVDDDVAPHLEVIDDHGSERGGWVEEGAVDDDHVDVPGLHPFFREDLAHAGEHHLLSLRPRREDGPVDRLAPLRLGDARRQVGAVLAHPGVLRDLVVERADLLLLVRELLLPDLLQLLPRHRPVFRRLVHVEAQQVHGTAKVVQAAHPARLARQIGHVAVRRRRHGGFASTVRKEGKSSLDATRSSAGGDACALRCVRKRLAGARRARRS
mmetsp:Transcript_22509/g.47388  ORF Transcript_22509/g.47388 Transcript_22509/m.47388 type:complete len:416 (+) Transcript_22509:1435-2682(+)